MSAPRILSLICLSAALLALPALAADNVIYHGIDAWHTSPKTYSDFANEPIPRDFFCLGSEPFDGQIYFQGQPVATDPPGVLGNADTIIQRLDDAVFNKRGVALSRMQIRAMSLTGLEPVKTSCGDFHVALTLDGEQPISSPRGIKIVRTHDDGGYFLAEFGLNGKFTFTPVNGGPALEMTRSTVIRGGSDHLWTHTPGDASGVTYEGFVRIDTNADGTPDTFVPGTSNFAGGWRPGVGERQLEQWEVSPEAGTAEGASTGCGGIHVVETGEYEQVP